MAESNGTTLGVDFLLRNAQLVGTPHTLRGEGLVDLEDVHIILGDAGLLQGDRDGLPGTNTHQKRRDTDNRGSDVLANDLLAQTLSGGPLHEQDGGGTVGDLRGVTGVDGAVLGEGRADLAERLSGDTLADTIVGLDGDGLLLAGLGVCPLDIKGNNLFIEETGLLSLDGLLVRMSGESVLGGTSNVALLSHLLRKDTHGDLAIGSLHVVLEKVGEFGHGTGTITLSVL